MKKLIFVSGFLAFVLFADYVFIALIGCVANACGASESFFCGPYCYLALAIITTSLIIPGSLWLHHQLKLR